MCIIIQVKKDMCIIIQVKKDMCIIIQVKKDMMAVFTKQLKVNNKSYIWYKVTNY